MSYTELLKRIQGMTKLSELQFLREYMLRSTEVTSAELMLLYNAMAVKLGLEP